MKKLLVFLLINLICFNYNIQLKAYDVLKNNTEGNNASNLNKEIETEKADSKKKTFNIEKRKENFVEIIDGLTNSQISQYLEEQNRVDINFFESSELFKKIDFYDIENNLINLRDFRGYVIILHFWASWCGPCVYEMLELNKFSKILKEKELEKKILIIPISIDDNIGFAKKFYSDYKINDLWFYFDKQRESFESLGLSSVPQTFIINKDGKSVFELNGVIQWTKSEKILEALKNII
jgi:thiol-disulfide isomerase/thioredoxin